MASHRKLGTAAAYDADDLDDGYDDDDYYDEDESNNDGEGDADATYEATTTVDLADMVKLVPHQKAHQVRQAEPTNVSHAPSPTTIAEAVRWLDAHGYATQGMRSEVAVTVYEAAKHQCSRFESEANALLQRADDVVTIRRPQHQTIVVELRRDQGQFVSFGIDCRAYPASSAVVVESSAPDIALVLGDAARTSPCNAQAGFLTLLVECAMSCIRHGDELTPTDVAERWRSTAGAKEEEEALAKRHTTRKKLVVESKPPEPPHPTATLHDEWGMANPETTVSGAPAAEKLNRFERAAIERDRLKTQLLAYGLGGSVWLARMEQASNAELRAMVKRHCLGRRGDRWRIALSSAKYRNPGEVGDVSKTTMAYLLSSCVKTVPPTTLYAACTHAARSREDGCDAELYFRSCDVRLPMLAALLQARLPRLDIGAPVDGTDETVRVETDEPMNATGASVLSRLISGDLTPMEWGDTPASTQVLVAAFVEKYGGVGLQQQLTNAQRGTECRPDAFMAKDLESWWGAGEDRPVRGRVARFLVGPAPGVEIAVHRELLCARSEYFARMLRGGLAESAMAVVPLEGVEAEVFRAFVAYVYGDNTSKMTPENELSLLFLAVEYDCVRLKDLIVAHIAETVTVENVAQMLQIAHFLSIACLEELCLHSCVLHFRAVKKMPGWRELDASFQDVIEAAAIRLGR